MPTITFEVKLDTPLRESHAPVNNLRSESDNLETTRVSWFPENHITNRQLKDGEQFTVNGPEAEYLRDNYATGDFAILTIVSESMVFTTQGEPIA